MFDAYDGAAHPPAGAASALTTHRRPEGPGDAVALGVTKALLGNYVRHENGTPPATVSQERLLVYDVASRQTRDVTGSLAVDPDGALHWSPDGRRLRFSAGDRAYVNAFELDLVRSGAADTQAWSPVVRAADQIKNKIPNGKPLNAKNKSMKKPVNNPGVLTPSR